MGKRAELRLFLQAVNRGWTITPEQQQEALSVARELLDDPHSTDRQRKTAQLVLDAMEVRQSGPMESNRSATRHSGEVGDTQGAVG